METGDTAPTWLDSRLVVDEQWADGLPDDVAPWIGRAFDSLVDLGSSPIETAAHDDGTTVMQTSAPVGSHTDQLDLWLDEHGGFDAAHSSFVFEVTDADLEDIGPLIDPDDPAAVIASLADLAMSGHGADPSGLRDVFDGSVGAAGQAMRSAPDGPTETIEGDDVLVDDIAAAPLRVGRDVEESYTDTSGTSETTETTETNNLDSIEPASLDPTAAIHDSIDGDVEVTEGITPVPFDSIDPGGVPVDDLDDDWHDDG